MLRMRRVRRCPVVIVLAAAALFAGCSGASDRAAPSVTGRPPAAPDSGPADSVTPVTPEGFERVRATVTGLDGQVCELCLWTADTVERRRQGLMSVTDLGDADGMAFVYPTAHTGNFWMRNTLLPLSIAFYAADGSYLDAFDMEPCDATPCPLYATPDDFLVAIETTRGDLGALGIGPGSTLDLTDLPCATGDAQGS